MEYTCKPEFKTPGEANRDKSKTSKMHGASLPEQNSNLGCTYLAYSMKEDTANFCITFLPYLRYYIFDILREVSLVLALILNAKGVCRNIRQGSP